VSTPAGDGGLIGDATIRVDGDTDPAARALRQFSRDAQGRLRDVRGRFVSESALINRSLTNAAGGGDRFNLSLRSLAGVAARAGGALAGVAGPLAKVGAAAGSAAPLLAGIVTTLENIAPAGAVAVTGMLAAVQASAAVKLGMAGVQDTVTAAFDTSEKGAKKFDEALKKLSPNAKAFALQVRELQPAFQKFQQDVQDKLFADLADELKSLAESVLPVVQKNITATASTLNQMAQSASDAARALATSGTLGKAMAAANAGLLNLRNIPGQVVTALGQLATAGAPAFGRLTAAAAKFATNINQRLTSAFESGALENAVNAAVDLLKDLGTVAGNVFKILGNIMAPVQQAGGGLIGTLKEITGALVQATSTKGFQDAIGALSSVMSTLARTVGPLLGQALAAIGPIFTKLGPPIERLITNLGAALSPIITALGPVLAAAADAVGILVDALSPLLPVIGNLIASLLPPLAPLLAAIGDVFAQAGPVVQLLGEALSTALAPILAQLPALVQPFAQLLTTLAKSVLPILAQLVVALAPSLASLGVSFAQILVAAAPLLQVLAQLAAQTLAQLGPALTPIISLAAQLAAILARQLASAVTNVIIPALRTLTALLNGDFSGAWRSLQNLVAGVARYFTTTLASMASAVGSIIRTVVGIFRWLYNTLIGNSIVPDLINGIVRWFASLPGRTAAALAGFGARIAGVAASALRSMGNSISRGLDAAVSSIRELPGRAASALGNLTGRLISSGRALINGFIQGIRDKAGEVAGAVNSVLSKARDLLPFSPAKEGPFSGKGWTLFSGQSISEALAEGIAQRAALVERAARMVAQTAQTAVSAPAVTAPAGMTAADLGVSSIRAPAASGPSVVNLNLYLTNEGVIGSPFEVEDWLIRALDTARRNGRLPAMAGV
jgi:phage-related protein